LSAESAEKNMRKAEPPFRQALLFALCLRSRSAFEKAG
jgi:hypothetical protein